MTRCAKFHHLFDEVGDFCGMSPTAISQYKAYREQVSKLVNLGIEEDFIFENFPEGPGRVLSNIKDDETRIKALNHVASCLKRGEKVTEGDLRGTLKTWQELSGKSCTVGKKGGNLGHVSKNFTNVKNSTSVSEVLPKTESVIPPVTDADRERKARLNPPDACHDGESKPLTEPVKASFGALAKEPLVPGPGVPVAPQKAPCVDAKTFKLCPDGECHVKTEANTRGRVCVLWNAQCSQLPGDACYIEYRNAHRNDKKSGNGFVPASQLAAANKDPGIHEGKPVIPDRTLTITFSPDQWAILGKLQKAGVADGYAGAVLFCVDEIGNRSA